MGGQRQRARTRRARLFIALTFGQQSWIRLLGIDHHRYMPGTDASIPGFGNAEELVASKAREDC
ncbi:MAG: hypothetical protein ACRDQD_07110 [Nocardioidaceae bacterium]